MVKLTIAAGDKIHELICEEAGFNFSVTAKDGLESLVNGPVPFNISGQLKDISPRPEFLVKQEIAKISKLEPPPDVV